MTMDTPKVILIGTVIEHAIICSALRIASDGPVRRASCPEHVTDMIPVEAVFRVMSIPSGQAMAAVDKLKMMGHQQIHTDEEMLDALGLTAVMNLLK